jgi:poly-gamma-glutamate synthesis protein (capsule biosynthesis protein)
MGHDTQIESALKMGDGEYDYSSCFSYVEPYIAAADIAIGNLEVTLAGPPFKGYPQFSSPDALAVALKNAGFDILVQANNHAVDRGKAGLERTLNVLDSMGLVRSGVFRDNRERSERYPLIVEKNGIRLALLNYTYSTNGIRVTPPNIVNSIDTATIRQDLLKAATAEPDFTIALMHWGSEYQLTENSVQQELAKFLFTNGTDAIIGSHPHVVQPIREMDGKLVVYSLGNMISNQRKRYTDGGIMFEMTLEKSGSTRIAGYHYLPVWVHKPLTDRGTAFRLVPAAVDSIHWKELGISGSDAESMLLFLEDTRKNLEGIVELEPVPVR